MDFDDAFTAIGRADQLNFISRIQSQGGKPGTMFPVSINPAHLGNTTGMLLTERRHGAFLLTLAIFHSPVFSASATMFEKFLNHMLSIAQKCLF